METSLTLTPTSRLTKRFFDDAALTSTNIAWPAPAVYPIVQFIDTLVQSLSCLTGTSFIKLSAWQAKCVWEEVIATFERDVVALTLSEWASLAQKAWGLCQQAGQPLEAIPVMDALSNSFVQWARAYQERCKQERWLDETAQLIWLCEQLESHDETSRKFILPNQIALYGFDELTPLVQRFLEALKRQGVCIATSPYEVCSGRVLQCMASSPEEEWRLAALWAKTHLEKGTPAPIGIVVPSLSEHRAAVEHVMDSVFHPHRLVRAGELGVKAYNMSAPLPLASFAVIEAAKEIIRCYCYQLPLSAVVRLSPYVKGGMEEYLQRQSLRASPILEAMLDEAEKLVSAWPPQASCMHWWLYFEQLLTIFLWPGERPLTSTEYQAVARWKALKESFAQGAQILPLIDKKQAFEWLNKLLFETSFSPESHQEPVQILGILEASGQHFGALWVTGMTDEAWPPRPSPNPLLPSGWQRELNFPHASVERELAFTTKIIERLSSSSKDVVYSCHEQNEGQAMHPSFFIRNYPAMTAEQLLGTLSKTSIKRIPLKSRSSPYKSMKEEDEVRTTEDMLGEEGATLFELPSKPASLMVYEHQAAPLVWDERLKKGQRRLKLQALCPYRGFMETRLLLEPEQKVVLGASPAVRGELVHESLAMVWTELKNSDNLLSCSVDTLKELVHAAVHKACLKVQGAPPLNAIQFWELERGYISSLLLEWLALESQRPPFEVLEIESSHIFDLHGCKFHLRLDRVDCLASGERCIIDYKTGSPSLSGWFDTRLTEPQMALYYLSLPYPVQGLFYAQLNAKELRFKGIAESESFSSMKPTALSRCGEGQLRWDDLAQYWSDKLSVLCEEVRQGVNNPLPAYGKLTCQSCHLGALCRYNPEGVLDE